MGKTSAQLCNVVERIHATVSGEQFRGPWCTGWGRAGCTVVLLMKIVPTLMTLISLRLSGLFLKLHHVEFLK